MERRSYKFGGKVFDANEINYVRRLAIGDKIRVEQRHYTWNDSTVLNSLRSMGLCSGTDDGEGKYAGTTYVATQKLLELRDIQKAQTLTFEEMAKKLCRDVSPSAVRSRMRKHRLAPKNSHEYPKTSGVWHHASIEKQGPCFTENVPVEPDEDFQFSSRGLTCWYVGEFCKLNHLRPTF